MIPRQRAGSESSAARTRLSPLLHVIDLMQKKHFQNYVLELPTGLVSAKSQKGRPYQNIIRNERTIESTNRNEDISQEKRQTRLALLLFLRKVSGRKVSGSIVF